MVDLIDPTTDLLVRTIYGEAANEPPEGWQAIAATAYNRAAKDGVSVAKQLLAPNQYQAWQVPKLKDSMLKLSQSDPKYQAILASVQPIASGHLSLPYDKYLNRDTTPAGSSALTTWAKSPGIKVGSHEFYSPEAEDPDILAAMGGTSTLPERNQIEDADFAAAMGTEAGPDPGVRDPNTHVRTGNSPQQEAMRRDQALGLVTTDDKGVSHYKGAPMFIAPDASAVERMPDGSYYYDPEGTLTYKGPKEGNPLTGAVQSVADVGLTLSKAFPDSEVGQRLEALQQQYNAKNKGNIASDLGRFGGQVGITAPILGGFGLAGNAIARSTPALAPAMEFLGGAAGKGGSLLRGSSLFANGALQGGGATALTSSTSDRPFLDQVGEGALIGGIANPLLHGIGSSLAARFNPQIAPVAGAVDNKNIVDLARKADKFNLGLDATQLRGATDPRFAIRGQKLINAPGSGFAENARAQPMKGTHAIGSTFGLTPADMPHGLTAPVMETAKDRLGIAINDVRSRQTLDKKGVSQLMVDLTNPILGARAGGLTTEGIKALKDTVTNIKALTRDTGTLTGKQYQSFIGHGSDFDNLLNSSDPTLRRYAGQLKEVLDKAVNKTSSSEDNSKLKGLLLKYKNMMTVAPLVNQHPNGLIPLSELQNAVNNRFELRPFRGKQTPLEDLAQIGQTFPNYGAIPDKAKLSWKNIANMHSGIGAGVGLLGEQLFHSGGWAPTAVAGAGGAALGLTVGRRVSNAVTGKLENNAFLRNKLLENTGYNPGNTEQFITNNYPVPAVTLPLNNAFQKKQKGKK